MSASATNQVASGTGTFSFSNLLRDTREAANQTVQVLALLLNISEEDYQAFEESTAYPDDEILKRLCVMMEWNFYDTRRMINNEMATSAALGRVIGEAAKAGEAKSPQQTLSGLKVTGDSLGGRLAEVRERTGQTEEIIAMLLNINVEDYREIEDGRPPSDETLRRISIIYDWNYHDLMALLRVEQSRKIQPLRAVPIIAQGRTPHTDHMRNILSEIDALFSRLQEHEQQLVLTQLELIKETTKKLAS